MPPFSDYVFRQATLDDADALTQLINLAYRPQIPTLAWTHESDLVTGDRTSLQNLQNILNSDAPILLLTQQDKILACVQIELCSNEAYIGLLSVHPEYQNLGLGKLMLDYAEQTAQQRWSIKNFKMSVITERKSLLNYYLRRGYQQTGTYMEYPMEANVGIPKTDLKLEYLVKVGNHLPEMMQKHV